MPRQKAKNQSDHVDQIAENLIRPDPPEGFWIPLRLAPYRLQAVAVAQRPGPRPMLPPRLLSRDEICEFVSQAIVDSDIAECELNEAKPCLVLHFQSVGYDSGRDETYEYSDSVDLVPHEVRNGYESPDVQTTEFITKVEAVWAEMEKRFRLAITHSFCRVVARCGSMHAPQFTAIAASDFALYKILDWNHGVAESLAGEKIYSIHVADPFESEIYRKMRSLPAVSQAARYFLAHHRADLPYIQITKQILDDIQKSTGRASLSFKSAKDGRALAADLVNASPRLRETLGIH